MSLTTTQRLADRVLTRDPVQRLRLSQTGLAMLLVAVSVAVLHFMMWVESAAPRALWWWTLFALGGLTVFFFAIRSGFSRRWADPSLTLAQMVYAIVLAAVGYTMAGAVRGGVFPMLLVVLMFGMFRLPPPVLGRVCLFALAVFALTMAAMAAARPLVYRPSVEVGHFLILACTLGAVTLLAARLSRLRERLRQQKHDLVLALARIQELATRDELTRLFNRRHMVELLEQERQRCVRTGRTFCLALIDIDHLRRVNDEAGQAVGDELLRGFARGAQEVLRVSDVLARWGGDEFALMLADTRAPLARAGAERLREQIEQLVVPAGGTVRRLTVSIGLTEHIAGEAVAHALERAARALHEAQAQGRNRVVLR